MTNTKGFSHFLLAAPSSGSGKTTLTLGLLRALANRGLRVQPFKCGPDYIDTLHHGTAAGRTCINLDLFMATPEHVRESYGRYASGADVAITEGVMGLFDGADRMQGSSASVAEWLDQPVILVVNAKAMAYSVAPLLYGFKHFYPRIRLVGAIFNFVGSVSHYRFLQDACADVGVEALGYLPADSRFAIPSRHLGLHISHETDYEQIIQALAEELPKTVDLDRLLAVTRLASPPVAQPTLHYPKPLTPRWISVARDEAFAFTYPQNLDVLARFGEITFFSPLHDTILPKTDFLYLPGGYPELYASTLNQNEAMREQIRAYCLAGGITYAECGGLMYLGQSIQIADGQTESVQHNDGQTIPMTGVLDLKTSMLSAKLTLGYRVVEWNGLSLKGHEFHYSVPHETSPQTSIAIITNAKGVPVETRFYRTQNTFASYVHMYWGDQPAFIEQLIASATDDRNASKTVPADPRNYV
ncbi:cobyrinate a,c-diamide synthase [Larkinella harenae]